MANIHLIVGPVGAGKSTVAKTLCREHSALMLNLDDWMARLFRPDRPAGDVMPWYVERAQRCIDQIWQVTLSALQAGTNVVLEIGLIRKADRESFYARVDAAALSLSVHLVDAPRDVRRQRVAQRNTRQGDTFSMVVPPEIFELASNLWEPPDDAEHDDRKIVVATSSPAP